MASRLARPLQAEHLQRLRRVGLHEPGECEHQHAAGQVAGEQDGAPVVAVGDQAPTGPSTTYGKSRQMVAAPTQRAEPVAA